MRLTLIKVFAQSKDDIMLLVCFVSLRKTYMDFYGENCQIPIEKMKEKTTDYSFDFACLNIL